MQSLQAEDFLVGIVNEQFKPEFVSKTLDDLKRMGKVIDAPSAFREIKSPKTSLILSLDPNCQFTSWTLADLSHNSQDYERFINRNEINLFYLNLKSLSEFEKTALFGSEEVYNPRVDLFRNGNKIGYFSGYLPNYAFEREVKRIIQSK